MDLLRFPRVDLAHRPTPLEFLPRLSARLGGPQIFVKRDDCTGLAFGGNKARKLEFLLADAIQRQATTIITSGGVQSNHARQTAAAAARLGLACELVLPEIVELRHDVYRANGNVLLDRLCQAAVHFVPDGEAAQRKIAEIEDRVRSAGGIPYTIPVGGSNPLGALGYVAAAEELLLQARSQGEPFAAIVIANGSAGTQAGLLVGLAALGSKLPVHGIAVAGKAEPQIAKTARLAAETAQLLGMSIPDLEQRVLVDDAYVGSAYGQPTPEMYAAVALVAQLEGLLLDPVYTGKAMAGLIDLVRRGVFGRQQRILFWHTGGAPGLFAYEPLLSQALVSPGAAQP